MHGAGLFHTAGGGSDPDRPVLSVVIPMFQESKRIEQTLRDVIETLHARRLAAEILAVDDGSTDGTAETVTRLGGALLGEGDRVELRVIGHGVNRGKGAAVRTGLSASRGSWVLMMDADNSARLAELTKLAASAERTGSGLIVGSRAAPDAEVKADPKRRVTGLVFRSALGLLGLGFVRDTQCGFKLYRRDAADLCESEGVEDGFAFDLEHLGLCRRAGLGVEEVGIKWVHHGGGSIHILFDGLKMLAQAWRIRGRLGSVSCGLDSDSARAEGLVELKPILSPTPVREPVSAMGREPIAAGGSGR